MEVVIHLAPRFDYGDTRPWICRYGERLYSAIGSNHSLIISGDIDFTRLGRHDLRASLMVRAGERIRISLQFLRPEQLDDGPPRAFDPAELDRRFEETLQWWRTWSSGKRPLGADEPGTLRSAIVLKALAHAPTGAILAAPTTSLPESRGGTRNWDYRYSWIRDSCFTVRALAELGYESEADGFRRFVERSAAGSAEELQIMYGVGGERRLTEVLLDELEGYRGARPVRIGNAAYEQFQLDIYGELLDLAWRWHERGHVPDQDYWRFLVDLVEVAAERWQQPDQGIWEMRGPPQHFVHSKAMCWVALDRGLRLAEAYAREVPVQRWTVVRDQIRAAIESEGYDAERGVFVQAFGSKALDAALLLMPSVGFVAYDDERMRRTVDAIREELNEDGLLVRYRTPDNLDGNEGVFLACSFWLAECLSRQGRRQEARQVFARAVSTSNDVGLFSEEYDVRSGEMLGNFPQGLTHLSHIAAAVALADS
jgi:GH15 family glucan-1,4-alpha-glucosidase